MNKTRPPCHKEINALENSSKELQSCTNGFAFTAARKRVISPPVVCVLPSKSQLYARWTTCRVLNIKPGITYILGHCLMIFWIKFKATCASGVIPFLATVLSASLNEIEKKREESGIIKFGKTITLSQVYTYRGLMGSPAVLAMVIVTPRVTISEELSDMVNC